MALTLTEAAKYTTNMVKRGVLEIIINDSYVMQKLPFTDVVGNAYQYLRESSLGSASFYDPNEQWTESTPTVTQHTAGIKIMGGDADIDEFIKATRSDKNDLESEVIEMKAKGIKHTFLDKFYYGNSTTNTKEFDGLHALVGTDYKISEGSGSTGDELTMSNMDIAIDLFRDGMPDCILMTRAVRRRIRQFIRANGGLYQAEFGEWGQQIKSYQDIPIHVDDFLVQTETIASGVFSAKTGGATSSIFFARFGTKDLLGLQNGGLQTKKLGQLETKDAHRWRIRWYVGLALLREFALARIDGVTDAAAEA